MKITIDAEANEITEIIEGVVTDRNLLLGAHHEVVTETKRLIDDAFDFDGNKLRIKNVDEVRKLKDLIDTFTDSSHDDELKKIFTNVVNLFYSSLSPELRSIKTEDNSELIALEEYLDKIDLKKWLDLNEVFYEN